MPNEIEFVQIEANEDAVSVRDRLSFLRGKSVLLIWPEEGTALTRKLDLVLIQREAMRRAIRLALVTHDPIVIQHAKELDISTFETIGASQKGRWKRGRGKVFTTRFQKPKDDPDPEALMEVASRVRGAPSFQIGGVWRLLIAGLVIGLLVGVAYLVVPSAVVILDLAEETVIVETLITASPQAINTDVGNAIIPARVRMIEIEEVGTLPTSGTQSAPPIPATGVITFINLTDQTIEIPAGTVVSTSAGNPIRFITTLDISLAGDPTQPAAVPIEALTEFAGDIGNVDVGLIDRVEAEWRDSVTVINLTPTTGGANRDFNTVTSDDREILLLTVRQQLQSRALSEILLGESEIMILESVRISEERPDWTNFSHEEGALTDTLTLRMRAIVQVVVVDQQRGEEIVFAQMGQRVPRGRSIVPGTIEYTTGGVTTVDLDDQVTFTMTGTAQVSGQINAPVIQERIAGLSREEALEYLLGTVDLAAGAIPTIEISPQWSDRLPYLPIRITIRVTE
ncbi:MAG: baseplate J/gp47 family protein [Anaerolineae bacterium]|jgi:hypothetical protein|nr:baseplate J/gp47 family protein [Anaerolineae bacterium]